MKAQFSASSRDFDQYSHLMAQHEDLPILGGVTARQEHQPAEYPDHEQVDEADEHERRA